MVRDAYARRRCLMPIDLFFEEAIKGARAEQQAGQTYPLTPWAHKQR